MVHGLYTIASCHDGSSMPRSTPGSYCYFSPKLIIVTCILPSEIQDRWIVDEAGAIATGKSLSISMKLKLLAKEWTARYARKSLHDGV